MGDMNGDFGFLSEHDIYCDTACQSLRPQPVIDALGDYYQHFNSCGERAKYPWAEKTEAKIAETRKKVLKYLKLKSKDYFVSFTLNTTYGINLLLQQLNYGGFQKIITSDLEHNSVFLSTMSASKQSGLPRGVIARNDDGTVPLEADFKKAIVVMGCVSNVDGRRMENLPDLVKKVHKNQGLVIVDAAQAMAHNADILQKTDADAICFSAHKMYAPSLGVIVIKKALLKRFKTRFIGGGMVDDVKKESYLLSSENPEHIVTAFEAGSQAFGEIVALGAAIDWLMKRPKSAQKNLEKLGQTLFDFLSCQPRIKLINQRPSTVLTFYVDGLDSHLLGSALADAGIMVRTGYFCVHYYLSHVKKYPPLVRFSLGYHNTEQDIEKIIKVLERAL